MYQLRLGKSIAPVQALGFKDASYRYGVVENLNEELDTLKKLGFYSVDVDCSKLFVPQDFPIYNKAYDTIKEKGIHINAIHMPIVNEWADLACQYEEDRKEIVKLFVKLIKELDEKYSPTNYVFHPGGFGVNEDNYPEYTERLIKSVNVLTEETSAKICLENMAGRHFLDTSEKMLAFLDKCKNAYTCVDVNHFYFEKPEDAILKYGNRIGTIHISDYDFVRERHWLPKEGKIDWNKVLGALKAVNYQGVFNYELLDRYTAEQAKANYIELFDEFNKG